MSEVTPILVIHNGDPIGQGVVAVLTQKHISYRQCRSDDVTEPALLAAANGCGAIIAVGNQFPYCDAVFAAAELPGVDAVVLVVTEAVSNFSKLRKRGVPFTVLQTAPLYEDIVEALHGALDEGTVVLDADDDIAVVGVGAADVANHAVAIALGGCRGEVIPLCAPERLKLSHVLHALSLTAGRSTRIHSLPSWATAAMRKVGLQPFALPNVLQSKMEFCDSPMRCGSWRTIESVARTMNHSLTQDQLHRRDDHALGMH